MKKLSLATVMILFPLSACANTTDNDISSNIDDDTVLWVNADGTDCDYGDWLEGDKDCDKKKKKTYVDMKSSTKAKKSSYLKSSNKKKSNKNNYKKKSTKRK